MKDISMEEFNQNEMPQEESVKESVLNETPEVVEEVVVEKTKQTEFVFDAPVKVQELTPLPQRTL